MDGVIALSAPQARLEMTETQRIEMYLGYEYAEYLQGETPDGWWYRMLALHPYHWLRLSGAATMTPWDALQAILEQPDRPSIALPPLLVALFLAQSPTPGTSEQRLVFQSLAYAVRELLPILPATAREAGWPAVPPDQLDQLSMTILHTFLQPTATVSWPQNDGAEVQLLMQMADTLWTFPAPLTRQIPEVAAAYFEQRLEADLQ